MSTPTVIPSQTFKLGSFTLDAFGNVVQGGSWKTTAGNNIVVTTSAESSQSFPVAWRFNAANQLIVSLSGADLFNFSLDTAVTPRIETRNAVLRITPDKLKPFFFELRGAWSLTPSHDLTFTTPDGVVSTLTGVVNSPDSKFIFFFAATNRPLLQQKLGFSGSWGSAPTGAGQLIFTYATESGTAIFTLPKSVIVRKATNQLSYQYQKGGLQSIDFQGLLIVNEDFTVTYHFSRRLATNGEVVTNESTISIGAQFSKNSFSGDLELTLTKTDGSLSSSTLSIKGTFVGALGKTNVAVGFQFTQVRDGQSVTTTFAFGGRIQFANGTLQFVFAANSVTGAIALTVGAEIKLGPANVDAKFNVDMGGGTIKGVTFLLGVSF